MGQDLSIMSLDALCHYLFENIWFNKSPKLNLLRVFFFQKVSFICYSSTIWFLSYTESQNKFELGLLQFQFPQDAFKNPLLNPEPGLIKDALFFIAISGKIFSGAPFTSFLELQSASIKKKKGNPWIQNRGPSCNGTHPLNIFL